MPSISDTIVQFSGLKSGSYDFDVQLGREFFERFENEELIGGDVHFYVHMNRKERLLLFEMKFDGTVEVACDRCLAEMTIPVEGEHLLTVQLSSTDEQHEDETDEDVFILPDRENEIDLGQWMYEYVVIALPMQHVHADDANGNPTCDSEMLALLGQHQENTTEEKEVDPRWAKLMELE